MALWTERAGDGTGIFGRAFGPGGNPLSAHSFQVSSTTAGNRFLPVLAGRDGRFVAAWSQDSKSSISKQEVRARALAGN